MKVFMPDISKLHAAGAVDAPPLTPVKGHGAIGA
jgi:hypothetical protein